MKTLGYITATVLVLAYGSILSGLVLTKLWLWFIVKTFDAPVLSLPAAIGITFTVRYLAATGASAERNKDESYGKWLGGLIAKITFIAPLTLFIGWVIKHWM